jgi:hypothetical protein
MDIKVTNSQMAHFFWDDTSENHIYHLANQEQELICEKKEFVPLSLTWKTHFCELENRHGQCMERRVWGSPISKNLVCAF